MNSRGNQSSVARVAAPPPPPPPLPNRRILRRQIERICKIFHIQEPTARPAWGLGMPIGSTRVIVGGSNVWPAASILQQYNNNTAPSVTRWLGVSP